MPFQKAVRYGARLRLSLDGPTGAGKTFTALVLATEIIKRRYKGEGRIALIDTEKGSSAKYATRPGEAPDPKKGRFDFDMLRLDDYHPQRYLDAIGEARDAGVYKVLIVDSLTHAWAGKGGVLELKDNAAKKSGNSYTAWGDVTPLQNKLIDNIVGSEMDVIATLRSKMEHVQEKDEKSGRTTVRKLGMAPVQRDGVEYEFDIVLDMDTDHRGAVSKTRCVEIDGKVFDPPDGDLAKILVEWLDGEAAPEPEPVVATGPQLPQGREAVAPAKAETKPLDQLGEFRDPSAAGGVNWDAFKQHLKDQTTTPEAWAAIAPAAEGRTGWNPGRWLVNNPTKTLADLAREIVTKQREIEEAKAAPPEPGCKHEETQFTEEGVMVCTACGNVLEEPPADAEPEKQGVLA
jgi:hypothetical protein